MAQQVKSPAVQARLTASLVQNLFHEARCSGVRPNPSPATASWAVDGGELPAAWELADQPAWVVHSLPRALCSLWAPALTRAHKQKPKKGLFVLLLAV